MSSVGLNCHHTARFAHNTGIPRYVRVIARALIDDGECLTLLVWDGAVDLLLPARAAAREHLARWSDVAAEWMLHTQSLMTALNQS